MIELDSFTRAYVEAALWSSVDEKGDPLDDHFGPDDIEADTLDKMATDCKEFQRENADWLSQAKYPNKQTHTDLEMAGHDFWLTRNSHGAGYWDGDLPDFLGGFLTEAAKAHGEFNLYVADGKVHGEGT